MPLNEFKFMDFGNLENGNMKINDLTILTGPNNSGKAYLVYALYGLYKNINRIELDSVKELINKIGNVGIVPLDLDLFFEKNFESISRDIGKYLKLNLPKIFNYDEGSLFNNTRFEILFDKEKVKRNIRNIDSSPKKLELKLGNDKTALEIDFDLDERIIKIVLLESDLPRDIIVRTISTYIVELIFNLRDKSVFILPSERAGLNLFYKELNVNRNALIENLVKYKNKKKLNPIDVIMSMTSRYPQPISDYIQFLNVIEIRKKKSSGFKDLTTEINKKILNGSYKVREDEIFFMPYKSNKTELNLHVSSSTVKSLFGLVFYLENIAKEGDVLLIDEPELNLHPDNHRKLARIICRAVNAGIRVIVSTHSDHFIKEINNLIMLSSSFDRKQELLQKYKYREDETLDKNIVSAYIVDNKTVTQIEITDDEGITRSTFDDVINDFNESNDEIYYAKMEGADA